MKKLRDDDDDVVIVVVVVIVVAVVIVAVSTLAYIYLEFLKPLDNHCFCFVKLQNRAFRLGNHSTFDSRDGPCACGQASVWLEPRAQPHAQRSGHGATYDNARLEVV